MINKKIAQTIVDKTISIINLNVNMMDENSIIIASGDEKRIGQFHEGAKKVIKDGQSLTFSSKEIENLQLEGMEQGITLPIKLNGKIVGAVGMTGEPEEVQKYGELVRHSTELMLEQAYIKEQVYLKSNMMENFLHDLLLGNWTQDVDGFIEKASLFGYDIDKKYIMYTMELSSKEQGKKTSEYILGFQKFKDVIREDLKGFLPDRKIISCYLNDEIVLLISLNEREEDYEDTRLQILQFIDQAIDIRLKGKVIITVGEKSERWQTISKNYKNIHGASRIGKMIHPNKSIYFYENYVTLISINSISNELKNESLKHVLGKMSQCTETRKNLWINTLEKYFECNLNVGKTADSLFIHRNTLLFRLNKIKEITGYDPQNFEDAIKFYIAIILLKFKEQEAVRLRKSKE